MNNLIKSSSLIAIQANVHTIQALLDISLHRIHDADQAISDKNMSGTIGNILIVQQQLKESLTILDAILILGRTQTYVIEQ